MAEEISQRIRAEYDVDAKLDLELEKVYSRFFLPRVRGGRGGSKKRYAGWLADADEEALEIVGLESVRRDWPRIARRLQEGMLTRLFRDEDILPFVREVIAALRSGELDAELVYTKPGTRLHGHLEGYEPRKAPRIAWPARLKAAQKRIKEEVKRRE